ncbi:MAG: glucose-6-phosphate isomerase [Gammaproteobacteria bacterium]|nr:glucose-6-phosphate isomerase [Gammaproteobacteria bacterium]
MSELHSTLPEWRALLAHAAAMRGAHLRDLVDADERRFDHLHVEHAEWLLDLSRQRITRETLAALCALARSSGLAARIEAMFRGDPVNATEGRAALHTALRSTFAGPAAVQHEVQAARELIRAFVAAVRDGRERGATGEPLRQIVNIGIGGSDLGPLLVADALRHEWSGGLTPHFVSNVDRTQLQDLMRALDPAQTLFVVCSKTFTTQETQANAQAARAWIVDTLGAGAPGAHFVAVSTNAAAMDAFGLRPERRFPMWDWVGGRYSVWSAVGLAAELAIGSDRFGEFLHGASEIDAHFLNTPFEQNLPVLLGLVGVWNRTFLGLPTLAVLPYEQRLARLPAYLQQLEMESNGKSVTLAGARVDYPTAPVVWGEPGSNAQHSFFQMLHQGSASAALDFIAPLRGSFGDTAGQDLALQNCFAQVQAFAFGMTREEAESEMRVAGLSEANVARLAPHRTYEGNRPSSLLLYPRTTARTLGQLLALYEHSVFVQGALWGINSFDQYGVELGKKLAGAITIGGAHRPSGPGAAGIAALIDYVVKHR